MSRASNAYIFTFTKFKGTAVTSLKPHAELLQRDKGAVVAVLSSPPSVLRFEGTGAIHRWLASRPRFGCTHTLYVVAVVVCTSFNAKTRAKVFFLHQVLEYTTYFSLPAVFRRCTKNATIFCGFCNFFQVMFTCLHKCSSHLKPKQEI